MDKINKLISLENKTALITGASSGIGEETAKIFAQAGATLNLFDINIKGLKKIKKVLSKQTQVNIFQIDLSNKKEIDAIFKENRLKPNIVVNNAGIYPTQNYLSLTEKEYQKVVDINLNSMFWICQNYIKQKEKNGIIVNISSIEAVLPFKKDLIPYSISKSGVISLTRSIARDYGRKNFRANVVLPGAIKTSGTRKLVNDAILKIKVPLLKTGYLFNNRLAVGRWGEPDEVAKTILFLSSDLASYVQGTILAVDGGFLST